MGNVLMPVTPEKITINHNNRNETITLINDGEMNITKLEGLVTASFTLLLPAYQYAFVNTANGFKKPQYYIQYFQRLKAKKKPFQWIVNRKKPRGGKLHTTNIKMVLESFTVRDDAKSAGFDMYVDIQLKEYKTQKTKTFAADTPAATAPVAIVEKREETTVPEKPSGTNKKPMAKMVKKVTAVAVAPLKPEIKDNVVARALAAAAAALTVKTPVQKLADKAIAKTGLKLPVMPKIGIPPVKPLIPPKSVLPPLPAAGLPAAVIKR